MTPAEAEQLAERVSQKWPTLGLANKTEGRKAIFGDWVDMFTRYPFAIGKKAYSMFFCGDEKPAHGRKCPDSDDFVAVMRRLRLEESKEREAERRAETRKRYVRLTDFEDGEIVEFRGKHCEVEKSADYDRLRWPQEVPHLDYMIWLRICPERADANAAKHLSDEEQEITRTSWREMDIREITERAVRSE